MNLANASVGQIMIPVEDFERGTAFYRDLLGIPFLFAAPPQMACFMCGAVRLLVGVMPAGQKAVHAELQTKGWLAEFTDPDGNQLALMAEVSKGGKQ